MEMIMKDQRRLTEGIISPYVFINTEGRPILQDKLREHWARAMKKGGLNAGCTRHATPLPLGLLLQGEMPEWVARTLGHVDTSMVYRTYGRYIPNLTRKDGSAFERQWAAGFR